MALVKIIQSDKVEHVVRILCENCIVRTVSPLQYFGFETSDIADKLNCLDMNEDIEIPG